MENLALIEYKCIYQTQSVTLSPQFIQLLCTVQRLNAHRCARPLAVCIALLSLLSPLYLTRSAIALRRDDTGASVKALQQQLAAVGFYNGPFTEYYGELTEAAVIRFQQSQGLITDGIAGSETLEALDVSSQTTASSSAQRSSNSGTLKRESTGPQVVQLQDQLRAMGVFVGNSTGYFGSQTEAAVIQFQRNQGLSADGIAGAATLAVLNRDSLFATQATNPAASGASLRRESTGFVVKQLQEQLKAAGFFQGNTTEYFGSQTEQAVIAFQSSRGLAPDGIVGAVTLTALNNLGIGRPQDTPSNSGQLATALLKRASSGPTVTQLQERLRRLGYFEGATTDFFGSKTESAVIAFQLAQSLLPDGVAGSATLAAVEAAIFGPNNNVPNPGDGTPRTERQVGVETIQLMLRNKGYYFGAIDGIYGSSTEAAVREFQSDRGLTIDGIVGPETLAALNDNTVGGRENEEGERSEIEEENPPVITASAVTEFLQEFSRLQAEYSKMNPGASVLDPGRVSYIFSNIDPRIRNRMLTEAGKTAIEEFAPFPLNRVILGAIDVWEFSTS